MEKMLLLLVFCSLIGQPTYFNEEATTKVRYFSKLTGIISPYLPYQPRGEIDQEDAQRMSHYKATYDEQHRIIDLTFYRGEHPNNQSYFGPHRVKVSYEQDKIVRSYFDIEGKKAPLWRHYYKGDLIYEEVFFLDDKGQKERLILLDSLGERVSSLLGAFEFTFETLDDKWFIQKQFDKTQKPVKLTDYFPFEVAEISVDEWGHLYRITNLNPQTLGKAMQPVAGYAEVIFDFDEYGNELGWKFLDAEGKLALRKPYEDTDFGYAHWKYEVEWTNRALGLYAKLSEVYLDEKGEGICNNFQIHKVSYEVNHWGEFIGLTYYDLKGEPMMHPKNGHAKMDIIYDDLGNFQAQKRYDAMGKLLE